MKSLYPKKVIVTSLTLALLLGGSALYTTKQLALAETADGTTLQAAQTDTSKQKPSNEQGHRFKNGKMPILEEAAAILGVDKDVLQAALKDKSLVDVAKEKGISEADLIAKLQTERSTKIDEAVKAGKIKAENAEKVKNKMAEHLKFMVNQKGGGFLPGNGSRMKHSGGMPAPEKLSAILGISTDELNTQLKAGKSLTEIAQSKGMTKEQLITKIKEQLTPWIEKTVDRKHTRTTETPQS